MSEGPQWCALSLVHRMWAQRSSEVRTLPGVSDVGSVPSTPPWEPQAAGWRGGWSCCCRRIPQTVPECLFIPLFLFEKFLLLSPGTPQREGPVLSHSPPLQLERGLCQGLSRPNSPQPAHRVSMCLPLSSSPPLRVQAT